MTDRELLERAAKAVKLPECGWMGPAFMYVKDNTFTDWNPLTDDGDRYRLARQLGINIDFGDSCAWKRLLSGRVIQEFWGGDCGDEAHAVVRAAAEIGRLA
jgi:hypothetical protein